MPGHPRPHSPKTSASPRDYYDGSGACIDLNLVLPIQRLQEFKRAGALGSMRHTAYSLIGQVARARLDEVKKGLGEPGNRNQQCAVLHQGFRLLFEAERPATVVDSGLRWKGGRYPAPDWDEMRKLEPLQGRGGKVES